MDDWQPLSTAAEICGVHRLTLGAWARRGKIKKRSGMIRNLKATLVNIPEVKAIVAQGVRRGRPKKEK